MTATSKPSKQQDKDGNNQPPKKPTRRAAGGPNPQRKKKRTEKEIELLPRQLSDDSEQEEEDTLVRRTVKKGITPSKGIEIREPVTYQRKASKKSDPTDKGKEKITTESESESDSDNDLLHADMSDEDEGTDISQLIASSTTGPSTLVPPIVTEAPHNRPTEVPVIPATESAPVVDDRTMTALPMREDDVERPKGILMEAMDADALPQTAEEPSTLT
ncbi:uncharacterized protein [Nicotiana tomentosiformis]|uniref:uncharacterized protein n=1 Tax=Nicotiana tomentosiformis TaxID=4098 RepID=UPI00388C48AB